MHVQCAVVFVLPSPRWLRCQAQPRNNACHGTGWVPVTVPLQPAFPKKGTGMQSSKLIQGLGWVFTLQRSGHVPGTLGHCRGAAAPTGSYSSWSMQAWEDQGRTRIQGSKGPNSPWMPKHQACGPCPGTPIQRQRLITKE